MALETFGHIDSLNTANPTSSDPKSEGDDHLRGIKTALKNSFPNVSGAVTATQVELNALTDKASGTSSGIDVTGTVISTGNGVGIKLDGTANTTRSIFFRNTTTANPAQVYSDGSLRLFTEDANTSIAFLTNSNGTTNERMRIDSSGNVGIGTTENALFNEVGGVARLAVTGSSSSTDITGNTSASIAIINTDQTQNNTAGLHFARADTDDTPNYAGASVVAQFEDSQVTGQYPKASLSFLTSTAANNAPSTKMTITSAGNVGIGTDSNFNGTLNVFNGTDFSTASSTSVDNIYLISDATSGDGVYGASISFSRVQYPDRRASAIASVQSGSDEDNVGLAFFTHPSTNASDPIVEAMRLDSAGNMGLGTTSPTQKLHVTGDVVIDGTNNGYSGLRIHDSSSSDYISYIDLGRNQSGTRLAIRNGGRVQGTTPWTNSTGNTICSFARGGIAFGSDTAAANTLDDYEEGTFTPTSEGTVSSYSEQIGVYTKIGNIVTIHIKMVYALTSGSSWINGLPFAASSTANHQTGTMFGITGYESFGDGGIAVQIAPNATQVQLYTMVNSSGANYSALDGTNIGASTTVEVCATYFV